MSGLQSKISTMAFSGKETNECVGWYISVKSVAATQRLFRTAYERNK